MSDIGLAGDAALPSTLADGCALAALPVVVRLAADHQDAAVVARADGAHDVVVDAVLVGPRLRSIVASRTPAGVVSPAGATRRHSSRTSA